MKHTHTEARTVRSRKQPHVHNTVNAAITCHFAQVGRAKKEKDEPSAPELDEESAAALALALTLAVGQAAGTVTETAAETAAEAAAAMVAETRAAEQSDPGRVPWS